MTAGSSPIRVISQRIISSDKTHIDKGISFINLNERMTIGGSNPHSSLEDMRIATA